MQTRTRATRFKSPRLPAMFPHRSEEFIGIGRIHYQLGTTRFIIDKKYLLEGLATIFSFINTALRMLTPWRTNGANVNGVRICRIDNNAMNVSRLFEPNHLPGF